MISGFNTEFKYKEKIYHVQTEDNGLKNPNIITLLYHKGAIIFSKKINYADLLKNDNFEETLKTMMKEQHNNMIRDVITGKFEEGKQVKRVEQEHIEKKEIAKSLDQIILDYLELQTEGESKMINKTGDLKSILAEEEF